MVTRNLIQEVREMIERHWTADDIAHRLKVDVSTVTQIINVYFNRMA